MGLRYEKEEQDQAHPCTSYAGITRIRCKGPEAALSASASQPGMAPSAPVVEFSAILLLYPLPAVLSRNCRPSPPLISNRISLYSFRFSSFSCENQPNVIQYGCFGLRIA